MEDKDAYQFEANYGQNEAIFIIEASEIWTVDYPL